MKNNLTQSIRAALQAAIDRLKTIGRLSPELYVDIQIERTAESNLGDYTSNVAMLLATADSEVATHNPLELASEIVAAIPDSSLFQGWQIVSPGFIKVFLSDDAIRTVISEVLKCGAQYGQSLPDQTEKNKSAKKKIQIKFISIDPTGPLQVGHGRAAAYGTALANLLDVAGYQVDQEYYVNDVGRHMDILVTCVWLRYLELCGEDVEFPDAGYQGDYVFDIAATVHRQVGDTYRHGMAIVNKDVPVAGNVEGGDRHAHIDGLIDKMKSLLSLDQYRIVFDAALNTLVADIKNDLAAFGITDYNWFSARSLFSVDDDSDAKVNGASDNDDVDNIIAKMMAADLLYESNANCWFRTSKLGDEKDRVILSASGDKTCLLSDIAYHLNTFNGDYDQLIEIWDADHHPGYALAVNAASKTLGLRDDCREIIMVQGVDVYRGAEKISMSSDEDEWVTLRELRQEVGNDAARYFFVMGKCGEHMDFDLELAKSTSNENPLYYIQYAHARIGSVFQQMADKGLEHNVGAGLANLFRLDEKYEVELMLTLSRYPEVIERAVRTHAPHQIAHFLRELANVFHTYYNAHQFLVDDDNIRHSRLALILACKQVLANGLTVLGVSAPEVM